nr:hypothetical protein [Klebsiella pneumoniae]
MSQWQFLKLILNGVGKPRLITRPGDSSVAGNVIFGTLLRHRPVDVLVHFPIYLSISFTLCTIRRRYRFAILVLSAMALYWAQLFHAQNLPRFKSLSTSFESQFVNPHPFDR